MEGKLSGLIFHLLVTKARELIRGIRVMVLMESNSSSDSERTVTADFRIFVHPGGYGDQEKPIAREGKVLAISLMWILGCSQDKGRKVEGFNLGLWDVLVFLGKTQVKNNEEIFLNHGRFIQERMRLTETDGTSRSIFEMIRRPRTRYVKLFMLYVDRLYNFS
uniref:Uncharacterized protein n=1 Tax=Oryza punctata TaxID=4537 RepID=A0A0E0LZD5_ORYPU